MMDKIDTASLKRQIETAADIIRDLTDRLEAERQRADGLVLHVNTQANMREKAEARVGVLEGIIARKEFDALKGEQVLK